MGDSFRAKDIAIKAQRKMFSKMSNKTVAKVFVDERTSSLLDDVYKLCKIYTQNKKEAEKVVKNIIKIVVKIGLLVRNDQLNAEQLKSAQEFQKKFHTVTKTIISFHEVDFTYDQKFLIHILNECKSLLRNVVSPHLTEKSLNRIEMVFQIFSNPSFLDSIFKRNSDYNEIMDHIVHNLHEALDQGEL
uniref:EOG090X0GLS n=1 Tax=Lynceus sp. MCZ IZ 141354 TaxID=1930659 RepID=A0A9N6WRQ0_9CRUS|nr:EOG090X0GLS [Lynceus sp. MCZ IZ 141354]